MNGNGVTNLEGPILSTRFTWLATFRRKQHSPHYYTLCLSMRNICKCHFSSTLSNANFKIEILIVPKLWTIIFSSNQIYFENEKIILYSPYKDLSNGVYHTPIGIHLMFVFKGFMARSQIENLIHALSFDHNSCKLGLNE